MAESTRVPTFKTNLVTLLKAANPGVQIAYRWPGPSTKSEGIYLAESRASKEAAHLRAPGTRVHRNEEFEVAFVCNAWRTSLKPTDADLADALVHSFEAMVDDLLSENPELRTNPANAATRTCEWSYVASYETETVEIETGVAFRLNGTIAGLARLT